MKDLANVPWHVIDGVQSADDALFLWEKLFREIAEEHAPTKLKRVKGQKTPWVSKELLDARNERDCHHRKARSINSAYHWDMYKKLRNYANRENRRLKSEYFKNLIEENKSDSKRMWKCLKDILSDKKSPDTFGLQQNHSYITDPSKTAFTRCQHISKTVKNLTAAKFELAFTRCRNNLKTVGN